MFTLMMKSPEVVSSGDGWNFFCVVNKKVKVPEGEKGLLFMREFLRKHKRRKKRGEPPFTGGFVGFLDYESKAHFFYTDKVTAVKNHRFEAAATAANDKKNTEYDAQLQPSLTQKQYIRKIQRIKDYLYSGDTYQVNFSQKFTVPYRGEAFDLYKKLTAINPSPFQFFMETPGWAVISNSPERLLRIRGRVIETRPIKGTVPRGRNAKEDTKNIKKLLASEKEAAELAMIVDLERNDLGKICVPGTVKVTEHRTVEKYSHVIHTVANVRGVLEDGRDWLDAIYALFPGGSITGCPKKRTMEIINRLEGEPRGVYCGSAGYIDLSGDCDFNIMIRTLWLDKKKKPHELVFRSGGGIVVDSDPEKEYEETIHKAAALVSAIRHVPGDKSGKMRAV